MSWLEKYKYFQKGIVTQGTTVRMQKFLKTNPTEEQLMMLDEMDKTNNLAWLLVLIGYFIAGLGIGFILWVVFPTWQSAMGV